MPRRITLLTTFFEATSGFSLVSVAECQIRSLLSHGYEPIVIVQENFQPTGFWSPYQMDLRPILPVVPIRADVDDKFPGYVERLLAALRPIAAETDVVFTHDIFFYDAYIIHNHACRQLASEYPKMLWLNWVHSAPHDPPADADRWPQSARYCPPPGYLIYPNHVHVPRLARMFRTDERQIRVVRHPVDPCDAVGADDLTRRLYEAARFGESDICILYPCRLDRSKQPEKVLRIAAEIERSGVPTSFLLIDWQATGERFQQYVRELKDLAAELDFPGFFVASELDGRCQFGTPRRTVLQLLQLADLFILPSTSETYSLVVHEAMLAGSLVVLNEDLQPMTELFDGFARYLPFAAPGIDRKYWMHGKDGEKVENEQAFWHDRALEILAEVRGNRVLHARSVARTQWNPDRIFEREIDPLLHLDPS